MGIKISAYYYHKKENSVKEQQKIFLQEKIQRIAYQYPITDIGESLHNCIGRI